MEVVKNNPAVISKNVTKNAADHNAGILEMISDDVDEHGKLREDFGSTEQEWKQWERYESWLDENGEKKFSMTDGREITWQEYRRAFADKFDVIKPGGGPKEG